jgi:hypothetical protein
MLGFLWVVAVLVGVRLLQCQTEEAKVTFVTHVMFLGGIQRSWKKEKPVGLPTSFAGRAGHVMLFWPMRQKFSCCLFLLLPASNVARLDHPVIMKRQK